MPSKYKFFSFGFLLLAGSVALSIGYAMWAFSPLDKERAHAEEIKGRVLYAENKPNDAFNHFLAAAKIDDIPIRQAMRYQWTGETCNSLIGKIYYFRRAYALNPDDDFFVDQLKNTPILNALIIEDQSMNDLTLEEWREKALAMWPDSIEEILALYADSPVKDETGVQKKSGGANE